ncbi:DoxX family protein [Chitinophaga caseinilytica]|uniref:DoxX family protein n=1 Tax=Chitinophaga caseinilytica TaxID=2267521 RepID=A0ABZ2YY51_9BACT
MKKSSKIIYWIATIWLALGMLSGGIMQLIQYKDSVQGIMHLGYPAYFVSLLGVWKILGVVALLVPGFPVVKEWAYAGFFFAMSGAVISHVISGDGFAQIAPSLFALILTVISWYFRPVSRRVPVVA